jgi:hypothetical protein
MTLVWVIIISLDEIFRKRFDESGLRRNIASVVQKGGSLLALCKPSRDFGSHLGVKVFQRHLT